MPLVLKAARRATAVALALGSLIFLSPTPAQAATYVELRNDETLKCLAIPGSDDSNGVAAVQWTCNDNDDQRWELRNKGDGKVWLVNKATGKCLAASNDKGVTTVQYSCEGLNSSEFLWIYDSIGRLRHPYGDWCLAVPRSDTASGVKPILWTCTLSEDQQWS
ncbi:RICIN domain-containing protein [Streptomyces sp. Qhu-G9]|uniref:RICIN domain-containing protein n=1 Tax=Streptomyces sp. Qhu-G9 TaxID=3452799 RepID=UPI0022ABD014|nr:RICIN domain-containing protein [Streptomyces aurantiacus]WAU82412.1 RICIN domain-containing protein [Streptomyces aurantiacus]